MGRHQRVASAMANHLPPCAANLPRPRTPQMGSSPVRAHLQRSPPHLLQESDSLCGQTVTGDYTARFRPQSRNPHQGHRPCGNPWGPALQESHHVIAACTLLEARHQLIHPPTQYLSQSFLARRKADRDWAPTGDNPSAVYLLVIKGIQSLLICLGIQFEKYHFQVLYAANFSSRRRPVCGPAFYLQ
jgi:hypothetical protein